LPHPGAAEELECTISVIAALVPEKLGTNKYSGKAKIARSERAMPQ
jgi:hypothetical protein